MSVKELEKLNNSQLQTLRRRQHRELKAMENSHQGVKAELKTQQDSELVDLQDENHRQLVTEHEKKERILTGMRQHLATTQEMTDKELKDLRQASDKQKQDLREKLEVDRDRLVADSQLHVEELNDRFAVQTRDVNTQGQARIADMGREMKEQYSDQQGQLQNKINDQRMEFTARFNRDAVEHKRLKDMVDNQNKHERISTNQRQQQEMAKLTEGHNAFMEKKEVDYRKGLKEQDAFFEQKYVTNHTSHTKDANNLDERYHKLMNGMKNDLSREMTKTQERLDDPFYHFTELRPTLITHPDSVEVRVSIPEYAKQDLQLTTNNKEVVLNFNRRYSDANVSEDGTKNKVSKVETFTSRIATDYILNPKGLTHSYSGGVMTYIIKKV